MRIIRIKIVKGSQTEETLSLKLLWTLCVHSLAFGFHSYPIYTTKRLHAQRNTQLFAVVDYQVSKWNHKVMISHTFLPVKEI